MSRLRAEPKHLASTEKVAGFGRELSSVFVSGARAQIDDQISAVRGAVDAMESLASRPIEVFEESGAPA